MAFTRPAFYRHLVRLKNRFFPDARIGIEEYTRGRDVLDVGCGPSFRLPHLEYRSDETRTLTGLDVSLSALRANRQENPGPKFRFFAGEVTRTPFPDKSFDTTIASFVIHHVAEEPAKILAELVRITRGHIVIFDHLRSERWFEALVQRTYAGLFDGGFQYLTRRRWGTLLQGRHIEKSLTTGAIFGHVIKLVVRL